MCNQGGVALHGSLLLLLRNLLLEINMCSSSMQEAAMPRDPLLAAQVWWQ